MELSEDGEVVLMLEYLLFGLLKKKKKDQEGQNNRKTYCTDDIKSLLTC